MLSLLLCHYATLSAIWKSTAAAYRLLLIDIWAAQTYTATNIPTCTPTPPSTVIVGLSASALARNEGPVICEADVRWMRCSEAQGARLHHLLEKPEAQAGVSQYILLEDNKC